MKQSARSNRLLCFELSKDGKELDVHLDERGLTDLVGYLKKLSERGDSPQHHHLMTEAWSGTELTDEPQTETGSIIHKVNLRFWPSGS